MAVPSYTIKVNGTTINNVQEFTISQGIQKISDQLRAGTGTIRGRRPDLLPTIKIGQQVEIGIVGTASWWFRVSDFNINYGIVPSMDTWELEVEDVLATLGRLTSSYVWSAGDTTGTAMQSIATAAGITFSIIRTTVSKCSAQVIVQENALEVFNRLNTQEQGIIQIYGAFDNLLYYGRGWPSDVVNIDASDDGSGTNPIKYDDLEFLGLADNYANNIYVEPAGLTTQSAGSGVFSATFQTYNQTTGAALDLANYLLGSYNAQVQTPAVLTARFSANTGAAQQKLGEAATRAAAQLKIKFRTGTYYGLVIGTNIAARLDDIIYTYYLAAPTYYGQFTLDSAQYGVLDTNRLGY